MIRRFLLVLLLALIGVPAWSAVSYQVTSGATVDITEHTVCKRVTNSHASGLAIFVPTNTSTEWSAFYTSPPAGITIAECGCAVAAGSQTYSTAGTFNFTVPCYNTLTVEVWGGGGGGGADFWQSTAQDGSAGGQSRFNGTVIANGGAGGKKGINAANGAGGAGGTASGGSTNTSGSNGASGSNVIGGNGGASPNGGAGGPQRVAGTAPGGGGGGGGGIASMGGGGGGGGAYSARTYSAGAFVPGSTIAVAVGVSGPGGTSGSRAGGAGAVGRVRITWN